MQCGGVAPRAEVAVVGPVRVAEVEVAGLLDQLARAVARQSPGPSAVSLHLATQPALEALREASRLWDLLTCRL